MNGSLSSIAPHFFRFSMQPHRAFRLWSFYLLIKGKNRNFLVFMCQFVVYWQHDAACRVIARLKKERDEARSLVAQAERHVPMPASVPISVNASAVSNGRAGSYIYIVLFIQCSWKVGLSLAYQSLDFLNSTPAAVDGAVPGGNNVRPGISASVFEELTECNAALSQQRKKRQVSSMSDDIIFYRWFFFYHTEILCFTSLLGLKSEVNWLVQLLYRSLDNFSTLFLLFPWDPYWSCRYPLRWLLLMIQRGTPRYLVIRFTKPANQALCLLIYIPKRYRIL